MMFGRNGLTDDERRRLKEVRHLVDTGLVGGELDGDLTLDEISWLAFWIWVQCREGTEVAAQLDPQRARENRRSIMTRIRRQSDE